MFKRTHYTEVRVTVKIVYPVLIKVRAYTRIRFDKVEKIRSHYRRYWGIMKQRQRMSRKTDYLIPLFLSFTILSNIGLTHWFSSMNSTTLRKSFQRFNNSIPAGAKRKSSTTLLLFFVYIHLCGEQRNVSIAVVHFSN